MHGDRAKTLREKKKAHNKKVQPSVLQASIMNLVCPQYLLMFHGQHLAWHAWEHSFAEGRLGRGLLLTRSRGRLWSLTSQAVGVGLPGMQETQKSMGGTSS